MVQGTSTSHFGSFKVRSHYTTNCHFCVLSIYSSDIDVLWYRGLVQVILDHLRCVHTIRQIVTFPSKTRLIAWGAAQAPHATVIWQNLIFQIDNIYTDVAKPYFLHRYGLPELFFSNILCIIRLGGAGGVVVVVVVGGGYCRRMGQDSPKQLGGGLRTHVRNLQTHVQMYKIYLTCFTYVQMYKIYPPTHVRLRTSFLRTSSYASPHIFYLYVGYKFKTASSTLPTLPTTLGCRLAARGI